MDILFLIIVLIFSVIIHEVSHGATASYLGDQTAKNAGRLTLNPLKHLDPIGTVVVPILLILTTGRGIGWAKPVPINPFNFRDQKYGSLKVAVAGPLSNLSIALFFGLIFRLVSPADFLPVTFYSAIFFIVYINIMLAIFNLVPIPPLDGSHIFFAFLPESARGLKLFLSRYGSLILIFLIFFFTPFFNFLSYFVDKIFALLTGVS